MMRKGLLAIAIVAAGLVTGMPSQAQDKIVWRMSSYAAETWGIWRYFVMPFVNRVNAMTEGRLEIQPFPKDVLAPPLKNYEAVQDGTADAAMITPLYIVNQHPANSFYAGHPGGMGAETLIYWFYQGGGQDLLTEFRRETMGLHALVGGVISTELWHGHKKIETPADLKGVKFRAAGAWSEVLKTYFDAAPVFVTGGEVYTMLERGGVDIAEWSGPHENVVAGLQNAAKFIMMPGTHFPAGINEFIVKKEAWDALPEDLQQTVTAAAKLAVFDAYLESGMLDIEAMDKLLASNNEIVRLDKSVTEAISDAGRKWAMSKAEEGTKAGDPWMQKIADSYFAFQDRFARNSIYRHIDRD